MDAERIKSLYAMTSDSYVQNLLDECLDDIVKLQAEKKELKTKLELFAFGQCMVKVDAGKIEIIPPRTYTKDELDLAQDKIKQLQTELSRLKETLKKEFHRGFKEGLAEATKIVENI